MPIFFCCMNYRFYNKCWGKRKFSCFNIYFFTKKEAQIHSFRLKYSHHNNILERNGFMLHSSYIQILLKLKDVSIINGSFSILLINNYSEYFLL